MSVQIFNQSGGAGGKLKVNAVASEAALPATAKEGTIAVITTTPIGTVWAQADEPASPAAGDVWIVLGNSSNAPINMAKDGTAMLYPNRSKQYGGSSWSKKDSYVYSNNAWLSMRLYAYAYGDLCAGLSGGWNLVKGAGATITNEPTGLVCTMMGDSARQVGAQSSGLIDLTSYATVKFLVTIGTIVTTPVFGVASVGMTSSNCTSTSHYNAYKTQNSSVTDTILSVDVSSLSGQYFVGFGSAANVTVQAIWLE